MSAGAHQHGGGVGGGLQNHVTNCQLGWKKKHVEGEMTVHVCPSASCHHIEGLLNFYSGRLLVMRYSLCQLPSRYEEREGRSRKAAGGRNRNARLSFCMNVK